MRKKQRREDDDGSKVLSALASVLKILGTAVVVIYQLLKDH